MPGQYKQNETDWIDDGMYGGDNDRSPEAIQKRIEDSYRKQGWWTKYEDRKPDQIMGPGCGLGRGWLPIVEELDRQLAEIAPDYEIHQIKEKFGGLRYYVGTIFGTGTHWDQYTKETIVDDLEEQALWNAFHALITEAENKCGVTCEVCGEEGTIEGPRWLRCRCPEHKVD